MLRWPIAQRAARLQARNVNHIKSSSHFLLRQGLRSLFATNANRGPPTPDHDIYVSASSDPYFNLTFEDWLFRHSPASSPLLFIYRDSPCVVIGRNQNPWTEVNFTALRDGTPFLRRRSGGGTVYHDLGNTNFSIHLPRTSFDRHATGRLVLRAVRSLGIDARLNERNDICVGPDKVSGSAYKIVNKRAYHHGTMLISTELDTLGDVLRPQKENIQTKGVGSVRSPVCNLQRFDSSLTHEQFTAAVVKQFCEEYGINSKPCIVHDTEDVKNFDYIQKGMAELSTWDWAFGQTPEFTHTLNEAFLWGSVTAEIRSKHGVISNLSVRVTDAHIPTAAIDSLSEFSRTFYQGKKYGFLPEVDDAELRTNCDQPTHVEGIELMREVYRWLQQAINIR
ncbi:hypothetical protein GALMADRAFT_236976 [Galerina marginata CBS 339.88]|uniref:Putative lipoate-protein ligase A n=1 Tax=Galerina marginata (strain CBS 339.88) TaxID=685588 RepID=A0A067TWC6_GALM3|nr:hypothetical protein GALMADRAFT_236976 [Galerina marginata CBS 339.88]